MSKVEKVSFEEALNLTGYGKFNLLTFLLCGSIIMGMAFELFSVAYLVPGSACELITTSSQQGLMAAVPLIGVIATSHFWGYLADTRGRRKVLCFSMTLSFVTGALAAMSPDWITFSILKFLSSSAVSGAFALSLTLLSECTPEAKRSSLIILTSSVFLCCNGVMAIIAIPVLPLTFSYYIPFFDIHFNSWRVLNLIYCSPCVLSAIGLYFSYESPKYLLSIGEEEKALEIMRAFYSINTKRSGDDYPVKSVVLDELTSTNVPKGFFSSVINQTAPLFKPPLLRNTILLSVIFIIVYICIHPFMVWLPYMADGFMKSVQKGDEGLTFCQRLRSSYNSSTVQVKNDCSMNEFALTMVFGVGLFLAVVNSLVSTIINYFGRKRLLITIQFVAGIAALCVNTSTVWYLSGVLVITFIAGILNFGMLTSFSVDVFPTYVKAMAVCLTLMTGRGAAVVGVNVLKLMLDSNCEAAFYVFGGVALLGGAIGFLLPSEAKPPNRDCSET